MEGWTPKLVSEVMIAALKWAADTAGRVGPSGFATSRANGYVATLEDHLAEGWGLPEVADPQDDRPIRRAYTSAELVLFPRVIQWQGTYLRDRPEVGRVLGIWLRYRAYGQYGDRRGWEARWRDIGYSRGHAYRVRDKGLSLIAQGLYRDRVPLPERITLSD